MIGQIKQFLFLDAETYYHQQMYTLRKQIPPEYILDDRFELICCSVAMNNQEPYIVEGPDFKKFLDTVDPSITATVTFNSLFDNSILAWVYGFVPALMLDSMNMARALRGHILPKLNLSDTCKGVLGIEHDKGAILKASGKRYADMKVDPTFWAEFCDYCNRDNARSRDIFKKLLPEFPISEMRVMDLVIRAGVQPRFMLDRNNLYAHLTNIRNEKVRLLEACGAKFPFTIGDVSGPAAQEWIKQEVKRTGLMSSAFFEKTLRAFGVEIEYKVNKAGKPIPAFAKTDEFMKTLQEHPDSRVQALACARLGIKSTIEETRTERLISLAALPWAHYRDGNPRIYAGGEMPIPLRYAGAHTQRLSGDWKLNMQNLPAGRAGKTNMLRKSLVASMGMIVIVADLAQIEARLAAWLARCKLLMAAFGTPGRDVYCEFGSDVVFGFPINKKDHPVHRFIAKTGVLGLEYQCGDDKFYNMVLTLARLLGVDLEAAGIDWTRELATKIVKGYRRKYQEIPSLWYLLQNAIESVWSHPSNQVFNVGPVSISYGRVTGPSGLGMDYANPRQIDYQWVYDYGFGTYTIHGSKFLENIIQFLSRIILMNAAIRLADQGLPFALQAHDELGFIVPERDCDDAKKLVYKELTKPPSWGLDIPLEAEVKSGRSYGDCK